MTAETPTRVAILAELEELREEMAQMRERLAKYEDAQR